MTTPSKPMLAAARAYAEARWNYTPDAYAKPDGRERHIDADALSTAQEAWFIALWEAGVAAGREQVTESTSPVIATPGGGR